MGPTKYVVPAKERINIKTDRETLLVIKGYGKKHGLTVYAAHRLIIKWGLAYLMAKDEEEKESTSKSDLELLKKLVDLDQALQEKEMERDKRRLLK